MPFDFETLSETVVFLRVCAGGGRACQSEKAFKSNEWLAKGAHQEQAKKINKIRNTKPNQRKSNFKFVRPPAISKYRNYLNHHRHHHQQHKNRKLPRCVCD
ncbi:uncharacterized protein Dyak_GE29122 [Drosophila yakuba]|uniref:Uncharacterized protein n=1 Tax=Drosophila yakuba TaxID=7245 RepID=A0A0R1DQQ4_DROYA|nr:uncharacterized protein Dyak_GE29122 [Drosophila yakuba]